jgi:AraC-like DNA-binding protein
METSNRQPATGGRAPATARRTDLTRVREHIDRHFVRALTIDELSALAGLSPFHFIRAFRAETGRRRIAICDRVAWSARRSCW